jgi:hypothetical protein
LRARRYFVRFHSLTGVISPWGVFTGDPVIVMTSPFKATVCLRTALSKAGDAPQPHWLCGVHFAR